MHGKFANMDCVITQSNEEEEERGGRREEDIVFIETKNIRSS